MSLLTAVIKISQTVSVEIDEEELLPELGIPDEFLELKYPGYYVEAPEERFDHASLQPTVPTNSDADGIMALAMHSRNVPQSFQTSLPENFRIYAYLLDRCRAIRRKIESETEAKTFNSDGDVGFKVRVARIRYSYRTADPVVGALISLMIESYEK